MSRERTAQLLFVAESASSSDRIDSVVGLFERAPGGVDPEALHRSRRGPLADLSVAAGEIAGAHAGTLRETLDSKVLGQVLGDPAFQVSERIAH